MASERQIEANRRNSAASTGPKTEAGKARSRANATTHGMAARVVEVDDSSAFANRRAKWAAEQRPSGEAANWALDRAVVASLRIERCERALDAVVGASKERAALAWEEDRAAEAAAIASGLTRDPVRASRRLQTSLAGVSLLVEAWLGLIAALQLGRDWTEAERSKALDLLGVAPDLRSGQTVADLGEGEGPVAARLEMAFGELNRLEVLRDQALAELEESDRLRAIEGDVALLSRPARLMMRYEREAWRHYREAMARVLEPGPRLEAPEADVAPLAREVAEGPSSAAVVERDAAPAGWAGSVPAPERSQFVATLGATGRDRYRKFASHRAPIDRVGVPD